MTHTAFKFAAAAALLSTGSLQAAQTAANADCMTRPEVHGLVGYMLPSVVALVVERCKPSLPANSFLTAGGPKLVAELELGRKDAWPLAQQAFGKLGGADPKATAVLQSMPEEVVRPMLEDKMADSFVASIKAKDCKDIDRILGTLAPLPAANMVDFVTEIFIMGAREKKNLPVCAS